MNIIKNSLICVAVLFMAQTSFSQAETGRKTPSLDGTQSAGPYYNPASKSYFELIRIPIGSLTKPQWHNAKKNAEEKIFKNTHGRLAIIRELATHQFIIRNFSARNIWIGLRYFCASRTLKWVDESDAAKSNFSAWAIKWSNTHLRCGNKGYMPVHYTTNTATKALRWRASSQNKYYRLYLVEYPTGKE